MHTPQVYYWTQATTKGTQHVASRLHCPATLITRGTPAPTTPYVLMTPTYAGRPDKGGYIPGPVNNWLKDASAQRYLVGVIGTGDINWGDEFCAAAHEISSTHDVPVLYRIDRWGNSEDHAAINAGINKHWATLCQRRIATLKAKKGSNGES